MITTALLLTVLVQTIVIVYLWARLNVRKGTIKIAVKIDQSKRESTVKAILTPELIAKINRVRLYKFTMES